MNIRVRALICTLICGLTATGCASLSIDAIPTPGSDYRDGYEIVVEFANVLNLPDRAKVVMGGKTIGVVTKADVVADHVNVTARVGSGVEVPSNSAAVLQQATVLGDIYLALERPPGEEPLGPPLAPGGRIPLEHTVSPPQIEDTLANMANFIGSGSIQRAQNTIMRLNRITPPKDEVRRVVSQVTTDLVQLSDNIDTVDVMLSGIEQTSTMLGARAPQLNFWFSPEGVRGFERSTVIAKKFGKLLPSIGSIYNGGYWLVPMMTSAATALQALQGSKQIVEEEYPAYRRFINEYFLPQDKYPAINVTSIIGPDGRELSGNVEQVLRMLGAVP